MQKFFLDEDIDLLCDYLVKHKRKIQNKTFLVTGGSGFIGSYLVETLLEFDRKYKTNIKIISVDNNITSINRSRSKKSIVYLNKDVSKPLQIQAKIDFILHAAGIASPVYYQKYPLETIDIAVNGTRNLLDLAKRKQVKSFVFFSSSEIYGNPPNDKIPTSEDYKGNVSSIGPRSCYDESKRMGETLCMTYHNIFKTPTKIVRPFNVFGPGMGHKDYRVIPTFIYTGIKNKKIMIHSNGKQTRTFCYVTDAIRAIFDVLLSGKNGEVYNIGNDQNEINMNTLARLTAKSLETKPAITNVKYPLRYPEDEPLRRCPNLNKIAGLGFTPVVPIDVGLKKTINWCKQHWNFNHDSG